MHINKFCYEDSKGDPKWLITFLEDNNLRRGMLPRYQGNRLHVIFHVCGILTQHYDLISHFLRHGAVSCGGLKAAILNDSNTSVTKIEMRVLGIIGKMLTGPWMTRLYTCASEQISHTEGTSIVRSVINTINLQQHFISQTMKLFKDCSRNLRVFSL